MARRSRRRADLKLRANRGASRCLAIFRAAPLPSVIHSFPHPMRGIMLVLESPYHISRGRCSPAARSLTGRKLPAMTRSPSSTACAGVGTAPAPRRLQPHPATRLSGCLHGRLHCYMMPAARFVTSRRVTLRKAHPGGRESPVIIRTGPGCRTCFRGMRQAVAAMAPQGTQ